MDETILLPSPNWFQVSNMAVGSDGWLIYGGPSKSICVLEPKTSETGIISGDEKYQAHVVLRAHPDKIVSVDMSPEWLEKRSFLTGSFDGTVKQWALEKTNNKIKLKVTHAHEVHFQEKEEVAGVGYSTPTIAITVGCFSNIVKWDLASNVAKTYTNFMRNFRPTCMACSPHVPLNVAVGTKQGVIFVLELAGKGRVLYKVRGQDDDVMNVSWCPQLDIIINKSVNESANRSSVASRLIAIRKTKEPAPKVLDQSGAEKSLPNDSFDESVVKEDDMFDIYKDHEADEFGHKKFEPEDIIVKVKQEKVEDSDYLAECMKLKEEILKRKNQEQTSITTLVNALEETHIASAIESQHEDEPETEECSVAETIPSIAKCEKSIDNASGHFQKHTLASIGRFGGVRIWSKTGRLVGSCLVELNNPKGTGKKLISWPTLLWYKPDSLLVIDGKSQLVEINPLKIDCKNKLDFRVVHSLHKRGAFCIATDAPRVQNMEDPVGNWSVWTLSQDRNMIRYSIEKKKVLATHSTSGGFVYCIQPCPYDAERVALSIGDGTVRVLETGTLLNDEMKLKPPRGPMYWQNVQGKVLAVSWHPTKENLLAFATGEARVGLIDTSGKAERPARVLYPAINNSVYCICWGEGMRLYASGGGSLFMYYANKPDQAPDEVDVTLEGQRWSVGAVSWSTRGLLVGSCTGAVAVMTPTSPHTMLAAAFVYMKMIHAMEWHPEQTTTSTEESRYKNLIAVSALDKESRIFLLEFGMNEDGKHTLTVWKKLIGHKISALHVAWNPHKEEQLMSTSQDSTVRIWDIESGTCLSIFGNHTNSSVGAAWVALPQFQDYVMTGGGDACVRLWNINQHKAENYDECKHEINLKKLSKKFTDKKEKAPKYEQVVQAESTENENKEVIATSCSAVSKSVKAPRRFMLPILYKQFNDPYIARRKAPQKMFQLYLEKMGQAGDGEDVNKENDYSTTVNEKGDTLEPSSTEMDKENKTTVTEKGDIETPYSETTDSKVEEDEEDDIKLEFDETQKETELNTASLQCLKIFGTINELNEYLDVEMKHHLDSNHLEHWILLSIFRGQIDTMIQFAAQHDMLCPFLLSMAPCVSFKYWRDATKLYLAQIDRLVARGEDEKLYENRTYGGYIFRKAAILLSMQDVQGAVKALVEGKLYKEAYILCRLRYLDILAQEVLSQWAYDLNFSGQIGMSAVCHIARGDLSQAAQTLARSNQQESLSLAAEIAKFVGRTTFADHVEKKAQETSEKTEEILKELPSKIELLMKDAEYSETSENSNGGTENCDKKTNE